MTAEALEYQRSCQDQTNAQDLLQHIFEACKQSKYWMDMMYMYFVYCERLKEEIPYWDTVGSLVLIEYKLSVLYAVSVQHGQWISCSSCRWQVVRRRPWCSSWPAALTSTVRRCSSFTTFREPATWRPSGSMRNSSKLSWWAPIYTAFINTSKVTLDLTCVKKKWRCTSRRWLKEKDFDFFVDWCKCQGQRKSNCKECYCGWLHVRFN